MFVNSTLPYSVNLLAGWLGFFGGAASGVLMGLFFHREEWLGGYNSFKRRMVRLGHIAFFGLGLINLLFAVTATQVSPIGTVASRLLLVGLLTMPLNCFLTAAKQSFRHLFFIPAGSTSLGIMGTLLHLL